MKKLSMVGAGAIVLGGLSAYVAFWGVSKRPGTVADGLRCPSQYATAEEAAASFQSFTNAYFDAHPGAALSDLLQARHDFYVSHNCATELAAYQAAAAGTADPATMQRVDAAIRATQ